MIYVEPILCNICGSNFVEQELENICTCMWGCGNEGIGHGTYKEWLCSNRCADKVKLAELEARLRCY